MYLDILTSKLLVFFYTCTVVRKQSAYAVGIGSIKFQIFVIVYVACTRLMWRYEDTTVPQL